MDPRTIMINQMNRRREIDNRYERLLSNTGCGNDTRNSRYSSILLEYANKRTEYKQQEEAELREFHYRQEQAKKQDEIIRILKEKEERDKEFLKYLSHKEDFEKYLMKKKLKEMKSHINK